MTSTFVEHGSKSLADGSPNPKYAQYHSGSIAGTKAGDYAAAAGHPAPPADYTPEQVKAIKAYTETGFKAINSRLRKGPQAQASHEVRAMMSALRPLEQDTELWRRTSLGALVPSFGDKRMLGRDEAKDFIGYLNGTFADKAFLSTSRARVGALTSAPMLGPGEALFRDYLVSFHIRAPKGTRAIIVGGRSRHTDEDEVILAPGTRLRFDSVKPVQRYKGVNNYEVAIEATVI